MEIERNKNGAKSSGEITGQRLDSQNADRAEVPSIRLTPEQIEEIHADEYSLTLFYATRVEPMTLNQLKREFPETEPKKAQSVMERFLKVGLVQVSSEGTYYSNYPENYINYSHYRYDGDLEARKDSKVFQLMKEFTGKSEYWKDKTYFSMDAFYTKEQSDELLEMFKAIKLKSKEFANENAKKKNIRGLKFRRMKFYDMTFAFLFAVLLTLGISSKSDAGGNDPFIGLFKVAPVEAMNFLSRSRLIGGGNDPTGMMILSISPIQYAALVDLPKDSSSEGGGGHDPNSGGGTSDQSVGGLAPSCYFELEGKVFSTKSTQICRLKKLIDYVNICGDSDHPLCIEAMQQAEILIQRIESEGLAE
ncbi:MAG: hypothetical protein IPM97_05590 [Bdellovibrionaceae bacterium]|nr:hypothetical protein [Pseudobdellovibrionaceae bacterium]